MKVCDLTLLNWRMTDLSVGDVKILSIMKYDGNRVSTFKNSVRVGWKGNSL
jgi:hypothetical protein